MADHRWVTDRTGLADLVGAVAGETFYAIDTEFHRERTYFPQAALVQVAWSDGVALLDPLAVDLRPLAEILTGPGTAVMHAAAQDLEVLDRECGATPSSLFDTQIAAGFLGFSTPSLSLLVAEILGDHLPKVSRLTDWLQRPLDRAQEAYAAEDVRHLLALHEALAAELERTGRRAWVDEECARLQQRVATPVVPEEAWWRIKEATRLRGRSRAVAQAVTAWRERTAAATDRPARMVLPDLAVVSIAGDPPSSPEELRSRRSVDGRHLRRGADRQILDAVGEGLALPDEAVRHPPRDDLRREVRPALALVSAWVAQLGRDVLIDPALLATRADVVSLLRGDPDSRLAHGWRRQLVGDTVRRLVEGRAAVAFDGGGRLALEARSGEPLAVDLPRPTAPWAGGGSTADRDHR